MEKKSLLGALKGLFGKAKPSAGPYTPSFTLSDDNVRKAAHLAREGGHDGLIVKGATLTGLGLKRFKELEPLHTLHLIECEIEERFLTDLETLGDQLTTLDLTGTKLTGQCFRGMKHGMPALETLVLVDTGVEDAALKAIAGRCPKLHTIDLSNNKLTGQAVGVFAGHKTLAKLILCDAGVDYGDMTDFLAARHISVVTQR